MHFLSIDRLPCSSPKAFLLHCTRPSATAPCTPGAYIQRLVAALHLEVFMRTLHPFHRFAVGSGLFFSAVFFASAQTYRGRYTKGKNRTLMGSSALSSPRLGPKHPGRDVDSR